MKCLPVSLLFFVCLSIVFDSCNSGTKPKEYDSSIKIEDAKKLQERANHLVSVHTKVRKLVGGVRYNVVEPVLPMDVLGFYILLPAIK